MVRYALIIIFLIHSLVTVVALSGESVLSVFPPFRETFSYQMFSDIAAALGIVTILCYIQLKKKGRSLWGLGVMVLGATALGSFSPLIYLLIESELFE